IRQYRLKRAVTLLRSGLNVSETAYRVGFTSASYFSNSFKEFYGEAPSAQNRVTNEGTGAGEPPHLPSGADTRRGEQEWTARRGNRGGPPVGDNRVNGPPGGNGDGRPGG